jgi:hypothetical protein
MNAIDNNLLAVAEKFDFFGLAVAAGCEVDGDFGERRIGAE